MFVLMLQKNLLEVVRSQDVSESVTPLEKVSQNQSRDLLGVGTALASCSLSAGSPEKTKLRTSGRRRDGEYIFFITQLMKGLFPG